MTRSQSRCARALARLGKLVAVAGFTICVFKAADGQAPVEKATTPKAAAAPSQNYQEMIPDPPALRGWSRAMGREPSLYGPVKQMVLGSTSFEAADFDKFFTKQVFPQFTLYKVLPELNLKGQSNVLVIDPSDEKDEFNQKSRLPKMREMFLSQFLNACKDKFTKDHLVELTVAAMREIAAVGNYHPLARYNAALLLGSLHEFGSSTELHAKAWPALVECLDGIAPVKVAAMTSILRHAKSGMPPNQQVSIIEKLDKMIADKKVVKGESPEAHDWIRRKAIEVLVAIGQPAMNAKVVGDLVAIVNDPAESVTLTCAAAKALGTIPSSALGTIDLSTLAANIGRVGVAATRAELTRAEERAFAAPLPIIGGGGANAGFGAGRRSGPTAATADDAAAADAAPPPGEQYIAVARLKDQLTALEGAFGAAGTGIKAAANGTNHAQNVDRVDENLKALLAACDEKVAEYETLKRQLEKGADALEGKLGKGAAAAAAGKAAAGDAFDSLDKAAPAKNPKAPAAK